MKAVILAGGYGTRISEETQLKPKPMVEIGGKPILWHIMKSYSSYGINDFVICCGYKSYVIKEYFANYVLHNADVTFDLVNHTTELHQKSAEPWRITLIETGENSGTGGRLLRVRSYLDNEDFCFTYGDGVSDVDIGGVISFHKAQKRLATVTTVQPAHRFGSLNIDSDNMVEKFEEKPQDGGWINGGFFVLSPRVLDYIEGEDVMWERAPLERLVREKQVSAYKHAGFWHSMDTLRDKNRLEELWNTGKAPWKTWT